VKYPEDYMLAQDLVRKTESDWHAILDRLSPDEKAALGRASYAVWEDSL
jgi:hypothetical protein